MKTDFTTDEEKEFLYKLLSRGIQHSDSIIFVNQPSKMYEYILLMIRFRRKCFEYLEEKDLNQEVVETVENMILQKNFEEVQKMDIDVPGYSY